MAINGHLWVAKRTKLQGEYVEAHVLCVRCSDTMQLVSAEFCDLSVSISGVGGARGLVISNKYMQESSVKCIGILSEFLLKNTFYSTKF